MGEKAPRKWLTVLVAMALMLAMMLASAVAPSNGQGGFKANQRATFGIATAVANTRKHDGCGGLRE